jgi:pimeloyl-ACP methyl ester carboxylesterase
MHEVAFDARGSKVRWTDVPGRLPARVFVHGLGGTGAAIFGDIATDARLGGNRAIVVDLPGHGLSDRPDDWAYSIDGHADAIAAVCAAAGVTAVDLVGHSLGADISVAVAARHPGLVARLVICEANLDPLPASPDAPRFSQRIVAQGEEPFLAAGYAELLATVPAWRPMLRLAAPVAVFRSARELNADVRPTRRALLYGLRVPRTFVLGELGEQLLDADGLVAAGVRLAIIPGAGHMMMHDAPAAFLEVLVEALAA